MFYILGFLLHAFYAFIKYFKIEDDFGIDPQLIKWMSKFYFLLADIMDHFRNGIYLFIGLVVCACTNLLILFYKILFATICITVFN